MRIGVDTGGTFTDCVVIDGAQVRILKVFSTPQNAAQAILEGVRRLRDQVPRTASPSPEPMEIIHGTTVATNMLLERRGARVALVTTAGFEDLIEIGRQARPRLYDLNVQREPALVSREMRWGVQERTAADGQILARPAAGNLRRLCGQLKRSSAESVAVCFLFSFRNPANERAVARELRKLGLPVSVSHEILPEFREYERLATTVINATLEPKIGAYLASLEKAVRINATAEQGRVFVMQSSGGITPAACAARQPVRTILSGPAGGVVAASLLAGPSGVRRAISFDMGGTSTDVCLLDGAPRTTSETTLGGLPVAVPVLDVHSVGAGGGSVARLDAGGALRVGPESAGAEPGPISYGRGGTQPTVTDAHLILGRLDPDHFLGGTFRLDVEAAQRQFTKFLVARASSAARRSFQTPLDLARGIVAVSNATMERALRVISVERGHDPRDFALICFGGAGGLHAADLASGLGISRVIVPANPGAFSALGILLSDIIKDVLRSVLVPMMVGEKPKGEARSSARQKILHSLDREFAALDLSARTELLAEGFDRGSLRRARAERWLDLRYVGQAYELRVPFTSDFETRFRREHEKAYGYAHAGRAVEIVNLRLRLTIPTPKQRFRIKTSPRTLIQLADAVVKRKPVWFGTEWWPTPLYARERLVPRAELTGPAIVVEYSSTTVVPPGWLCRVDKMGSLVLSPESGATNA